VQHTVPVSMSCSYSCAWLRATESEIKFAKWPRRDFIQATLLYYYVYLLCVVRRAYRALWGFMEKLLSDIVLTCKYIRDNVTQLPQLINTPPTPGLITASSYKWSILIKLIMIAKI